MRSQFSIMNLFDFIVFIEFTNALLDQVQSIVFGIHLNKIIAHFPMNGCL